MKKFVVVYQSVNGKFARRLFDKVEDARTFTEKLKSNKLCKVVYPIVQE